MPKKTVERRGLDKARGTQGPGGRGVRSAAAPAGSSPARTPSRAERAADRRAAIIEAAFDTFIAEGYAATRLDDVAKRAGVAKGTIYLHFKDKQALFEELVRNAIVPLASRLAAPPPATGSVRALLENFADTFVREVTMTRRGAIVRLVIAEGPRFPAIADFYYREVVSRGMAGMRALIELGIARGEIHESGLKDFPQIVIAPAMVAVIWQGLFARHAPLDATAMLRVHLDLIFGERRAA
ncbi:MAG TPA: TetR/AcrR family transcriptional regulator [Bradyrhizobium sp.]|uniref:TetR/AcrR family transcriptional regulator n=1 Tax=Bradyrhizobium sp. TaxID=376 RepID=UPI002D80F2D1|nr:TetR/AcrR family transcriptional regulator [Bradyrhizobium sp.]HET7889546.1 TetR/AcrR family transcriptional regulator [Bradyrhizobium sp.]